MEVILPNKKRLFIIGASGFGREIESWLELIPETERVWQIAGYFDMQERGKIQGFPSGYEIIGNEDTFSFKENDFVILAIAEPTIKERIYKKLRDRVNFVTYIAPNAIVGKFCQIGEGSIICPNCVVTTNVVLGACVTLNIGTQIGHDVKIGDFSSLMANVDIGGKCALGKRVYFGTNSSIVPCRKVADDVRISAGSLVIRSIKSKVVVFGNPAVKVKP
jgi:sugar O-acyltransferase (sialic acid O-acetyltransferase NeuD family)